ncbi:MAG: excinuclease ABC subunit UvrB, partial [Xanthobacteraceae bacterium]
MAKPPGKPPQKRDPAKHSNKDPARPTRAKAARPDLAPIEPALAQLLNPGIAQGTAGPGSQTGLKPPPDNSFDRRRDFSEAHRARKSTQGFGEAPQSGYVAKSPVSPGELDPDLARALGIEDDIEGDAACPPSPEGGGSRAEGARGGGGTA